MTLPSANRQRCRQPLCAPRPEKSAGPSPAYPRAGIPSGVDRDSLPLIWEAMGPLTVLAFGSEMGSGRAVVADRCPWDEAC